MNGAICLPFITERKRDLLTVKAPAKINLTLEVLGRRRDGYHNIRSILQTVSLYDKISITEAKDISFSCNLSGWQAEQSLVSRAAQLLIEKTGVKCGAKIKIEKNIPLLSGLGGDSSDAVAVLKGLNKIWALHLPCWQLAEMAAELGSDTTYFVFGGTAMAEGKGGALVLLPDITPFWVVLLMPEVERSSGKTGKMYDSVANKRFSNGHISDTMMEDMVENRPLKHSSFYNVFEEIAMGMFKGLEEYRWRMLEAGAYQVMVAGSGPALFSLIKEKKLAQKVYKELKRNGNQVYLAQTIGQRD
jgi:4-diphosphocytidyl-2-C-methyl-D-erythritol kinase